MQARDPTRPPVLEAVYDCRQQQAPTGYRWLCRWTLDPADQRPKLAEPIFLIPDAPRLDTSPITEGYSALSPNWQYYYCSEYLASDGAVYTPATLLSARSCPPTRLDIPMLFRAVFSPDSRWLCGTALTPRLAEGTQVGDFYCIECASGKVRCLFKAPKRLVEFGWYPDNLHLWFTVERTDNAIQVFKLNTRTSKRILLQGVAARAPFQNWDLQNPRFRSTPLASTAAYAYSLSGVVRVRVSPTGNPRTLAGVVEVFVERREGQTHKVLHRDDHSWQGVIPLDVSEDGRWVLLWGQTWVRLSAGEEASVRRELVALDTQTKRLFYYNALNGMPDWRFMRGDRR